MPDVSGLVLGTIALASLFSTCIELFDYFELGRNYASDYQLACTKMSLLKARLWGWGASLQIENPGHENPLLRRRWPDEQHVIARSLFGIKEIFESATGLAEKYKLTPRDSRVLQTTLPFAEQRAHESQLDSLRAAPTVKAPRSRWTLLRKRTVWAIHDKPKFDNLIQDLSFLIENLEKVAERLAMPTIKTHRTITKPSFMSDETQQSMALFNRETYSMQNRSSPPQQSAVSPTKTGTEHRQSEHLKINEVVVKLDGDVFQGNQQTDSGVVVMGTVGQSDSQRRNMYTGDQKLDGHGFGVMGNISADAVRALRQPPPPPHNSQSKQDFPNGGSSASENSDNNGRGRPESSRHYPDALMVRRR